MQLINIGFGNMVSSARVIAIVSPESAPIKRIIQEAKDKGTLIDATYGRRTMQSCLLYQLPQAVARELYLQRSLKTEMCSILYPALQESLERAKRTAFIITL